MWNENKRTQRDQIKTILFIILKLEKCVCQKREMSIMYIWLVIVFGCGNLGMWFLGYSFMDILTFSETPMDGTSKVPRFPLRRIANNSTTRATLIYIIIDDLA